MMKFRSLALAFVLAQGLVVVAPAHASQSIIRENATHDRQQWNVFAVAGFWGVYTHFGVGAWYAYPIVPEGFLPKVNDAFFIEAGGAVERFNYGATGCNDSWFRVTPLGGVRWSFYFTDEWSAFGTAKLGYGLGFGDSSDCDVLGTNAVNVSYSQFAIDGAVGAQWQFSDAWAMRFELGYLGATVGVGSDL